MFSKKKAGPTDGCSRLAFGYIEGRATRFVSWYGKYLHATSKAERLKRLAFSSSDVFNLLFQECSTTLRLGMAERWSQQHSIFRSVPALENFYFREPEWQGSRMSGCRIKGRQSRKKRSPGRVFYIRAFQLYFITREGFKFLTNH